MKKIPGKSPGPAGFTLVEILVTVVVIALGCLAALWMQAAAMSGHAQSDHLTAASYLVESEVERLRSLPFDPPGDDREEIQRCLNRQGQLGPTPPANPCPKPFPYERTVRYFKATSQRIYQVDVEVKWRATGGSERKVLYTAALTDISKPE